MERHGSTNLSEAVRSVQLLKIDGYCATAAMNQSDYIRSSERFLAHRAILAARSPVFMAEFFGGGIIGMKERSSQSVRIEDMDADVFKGLLHFIYTDTAPELDEETEVAVTMAQHLLAAADRYGLDRLKLMCESKLAGGFSIETVATTLALAEQLVRRLHCQIA